MDDPDITPLAMVAEWPVRSLVTILLPLLFAATQLINSYYHGVSLAYSGMFAALFVGMAILMTQKQCATFRATQLRAAHTDEE